MESIHLAKVIAGMACREVCTPGYKVFHGKRYFRVHPVSFHSNAARSLYNFLDGPSYHGWQPAKTMGAL